MINWLSDQGLAQKIAATDIMNYFINEKQLVSFTELI